VSTLCVPQPQLVYAPQLRRSGGRAAVYELPSTDDRAAKRGTHGAAQRREEGGLNA